MRESARVADGLSRRPSGVVASVKPERLGDEPDGQTEGRLLGVVELGGWNIRINTPSLPLSFYTEFLKILRNKVVVVIITVTFPRNSMDLKPLTEFPGHINNWKGQVHSS